jgi:hypothetical protein
LLKFSVNVVYNHTTERFAKKNTEANAQFNSYHLLH